MKFLIIALIGVLNMGKIEASPQAPELLIVGNDAIPIFQYLFKKKLDLGDADFDADNKLAPLNLWRGFQGVWQIIDDCLYLVNLNCFRRTSKNYTKKLWTSLC